MGAPVPCFKFCNYDRQWYFEGLKVSGEQVATACRREPGNYAAKWGLKLQEVLLDRCRMSKCQVISVKVEDLVHAGPDVLAEAEVIGRKLRRTLAEREAKRRFWKLARQDLDWLTSSLGQEKFGGAADLRSLGPWSKSEFQEETTDTNFFWNKAAVMRLALLEGVEYAVKAPGYPVHYNGDYRKHNDYDKYMGRDVSMQAATWLGVRREVNDEGEQVPEPKTPPQTPPVISIGDEELVHNQFRMRVTAALSMESAILIYQSRQVDTGLGDFIGQRA
ncbi:hypothetical protein AK812_SmicGene29067 [Symbiodinium microadriaticum]|uniref:Uncharacterized protein n=1 Tax=Symbiodinium microadriaticum TaxID=2951 RepID=A0A1Q9D2T2_SYMMI|nr:hypothetical protein AK812_SmicGene29067 [Symbiodinium microadriaticum]